MEAYMRVSGASGNAYAATPVGRAGAAALSAAYTDTASTPRSSGGSNASSTYDFTSITPSQLGQTIGELVSKGQLDQEDTVTLADSLPTSATKTNFHGKMPSIYDQPNNMIARLQDGIDDARNRNDLQSVHSLSKTLNVFQRLQGAPRGISLQA
jgi:hypothetical protein